MARFTLSKQERLSSLKEIEILFAEGISLTKYPLRLIWRENSNGSDFPAQVMFSVSKKKFSSAVDRNRIKRLLRESYRLQKPDFYMALPEGRKFHLGLIYTGSEILDLDAIQKSLSQALERMITQCRQPLK
ncbi:MAG TPA: ribonuclease P protein component [Saprospiraceae bacterium]|nr:ribonuclease P protein component [Saprospiraceae bacterium]